MTSPETSELIERTIRLCAIEVHPSGELKRLAAEMGVTTKVFRYWWTRGRVPKVKAEWLKTRFPNIVQDTSTLIG